jgi:hypothetical protein
MFVLGWKIKYNSDTKHKVEDKKMVHAKKYFFLILFIGFVFTILASFWTEWTEYTANPVLDPASGVRAYYPSVIYNQDQFSGHGTAAYYKMWFASPDSGISGGIALAYSNDGINWTEYNNSLPLAGLNPSANHPAVLYDPTGFGGGTFYYKTWYWDSSTGLNTINTIRYAESVDGITWQNDQPIQQHPTDQTLQLVDGVSGSYFYHCYGPGSLLYNPAATNVGSGTPDDKSDDSPMTYRYVMYYDSSGEGASPNGSIEQESLVYSIDGIYWIRYGNEPVLLPSGNQSHWDGWYSYRGCVVATASGYHMWYSGANGDNSIGTYYAHCIGHASSSDGLNWIKDPDNPIFHVTDGVGWRNVRSYAPWVLFDANQFSGHGAPVNWKMYFTGLTGSNYTIGYAELADELPVAVMDCISTGSVGAELCLDGSASYDPDGDNIAAYTWDLTARPAGSSAAMSPADEAQSCFTPDLPGTYTVSLRAASINGGGETTWSEEITCDVTTQDQPPVAEFNCIREGMMGEEACFDGGASNDPDGEDIVEYSWRLAARPAGSAAVMSPANEVRSCFTPDMPGTYQVSLRVASVNVSNETVWSEETTCNMTVTSQDQPPAAVFACPPGEEVGKEICLNGSSSYDPDGDEIIEYSWGLPVKPAGSAAVMSPANEVQSCFTPDLPGTYQVSLRVASVNAADETVRSEETICSITTRDRLPIPVIKTLSAGTIGENYCFSGSDSYDPDGDNIVDYTWRLAGRPQGSKAVMSPNNTVQSCFIPDVGGTYTVALVVTSENAGGNRVQSIEITVEVTPRDRPPLAVFRCIPNGETGEKLCFDASSSSDPDGDEIIEYTWGLTKKPRGSSAAMNPRDGVRSCFIPDVPGTYLLSLNVSSKNIPGEVVRSDAAQCEIFIKDRIPVAVFTCTPLGKVGETICFDASASYDPDGTVITDYSWSILSKPLGSQVGLSSQHTANTCFSPDMEGIYSISLQVSSQTSAGEAIRSKNTDCVIQIQGYAYCFCPEVVLNVERVEDRMWHKSYKIEKLNWATTCLTPCCEIEKYGIYRMENGNWELVAEVDTHVNSFELKDVNEWHEYKVIPFLPGNRECLGRIELDNQPAKPQDPNAGRRMVEK